MFSRNAMEAVREGVRRGEPVRGPFDVQVMPVTYCNQACVFCPLHCVPDDIKRVHAPRFIESPRKMDWDIFERLAVGLAELGGVERVHFTGGEPLMHHRIADMVAAFKKISPRATVAVVTNGLLLAERFAELAAAGINRISVSINAADEETYLKISPTNRSENFRKLLDGLKQVRDYRRQSEQKEQHTTIELALTCVLTRYNYRQAARLLEIAAASNADSVTFIPLVPFELGGVPCNARFAVTGEQFRDFVENISSLAPEAREKGIWMGYGGSETDGGILKVSPHDMPRSCYAGFSFVVFWPDGAVRPCCNCEHVAGDITRQSLAEIWHSKPYGEFRMGAIRGNLSPQMGCSCNECGYLTENRCFEKYLNSSENRT